MSPSEKKIFEDWWDTIKEMWLCAPLREPASIKYLAERAFSNGWKRGVSHEQAKRK